MSAEVPQEKPLGNLAALIAEKDWSETALGPRSGWSHSFETILRLMLTSRYSMWIGWGPDLLFFYNDTYARETLGPKHPWALGRPAREVWAEVWDTLAPRVDQVLQTGQATWDEGLLLFLQRSGYPEETYHTFSYSPAPGDKPDEIGGLFCVVVEETERVISDRRLSTLRFLAASLGSSTTAKDVFQAVEDSLVQAVQDLPFALTYLFDEKGETATLFSRSGFSGDHRSAPVTVSLDQELPWPLREVAEGAPLQAVDLTGEDWPQGVWKIPPQQALVVPIPRQGEDKPAGVFIAGLNPHRSLDEPLKTFVGLFVGQLAAGLSNANAYEETRKRADALAEIDRAKTTFFSNVSHEFRTPLTLMLGPTEDALRSPEQALAGPDLAMVYRNELRLLKLVNALLDFARIEAGRMQASYQPTDLQALTVDLASTFRSAVERAGLTFEVDCQALPKEIYVDHDLWEKVVLNLLSNALKFTFDGTISVRLRWNGDQAETVVRDTGVGIAESELPRLFERFHRIEGGRARTHEGSGIGLALVQELVRLHGGTITAESEVGRGTAFTVRLPAGKAHLTPERIGAPSARAVSPGGASFVEEALRWTEQATRSSLTGEETGPHRMPTEAELENLATRILVVDDNADMREYIVRLLRTHWTVDTAQDGVEALVAAKRNPPDLVLSDVMMPRLDGFGLIRELRRDPATMATPVILLSARAGEEATAEGLRAGADDYLVKPFSASSLLVRVETQLSALKMRKAMRRSKEAEQDRLEAMFAVSPAAMAVLRGDAFVIELANPLMIELWGKTPEVIGKPLLEALPELEGQGFDDLLREVLTSGTTHLGKEAPVRLVDVHTGEKELHVDFVYAPMINLEGKAEAVFVHAYDVSDKVLARRKLEELRTAEQEARRDSEAANRLKDEFLATMSHELRTPLNAILGWSTLLRRGSLEAKDVPAALATIERNAKAQARLIEDVLDVSRIISGKLRLEMKRVDLDGVARAAIDVVHPAADAKKVTLVVDLPPSHRLDLVGDADRLQQVVWNLLSNAVKFTPAGGSVFLAVERVEGAAKIIVRDTGPGIAPEHLPFIFERFRQVDNTISRQHGGLGLGLAIVRHLVELHGGQVTAESSGKAGAGVTFTVHLPIRALHPFEPEEAEAPSEMLSPSTQGPLSRRSPMSGISVLVVDDDEDARMLLESALGRSGAAVTAVDSAHAALAFLENHKVDVMISDIGMPGEDGFALMRRVRALPASRGGLTPAIALTAYARREDVAKAIDVGFMRHFSKPADVDALGEAVTALAAAHR